MALISSADHAIAISPAISKKFSPKTKGMISELRDYRVNKSEIDLFKILEKIPQMEFDPEDIMIMYGSRDVPEIILECEELTSDGYQVVKIDNALHVDIYTLESAFEVIISKLQEWY